MDNPAIPGRDLYGSQLSSLQNFGFVTQLFDLTVDRRQGQQVELAGDWLAVDPRSQGAMRADMAGAGSDDVLSILLHPGQVVRFPFRALRLFNAPVAAGFVPVSSMAKPNAQMVLNLGIGACPFDATDSDRDGSVLTVPASTNAPGQASAQVAVTEGARLEIYFIAVQNAGAAATSLLRGQVNLIAEGPFVAQTIYPDNQDVMDAGANTTARTHCVFRNIVVPRGVVAVNLIALNYGTEAAANVSLAGGVTLK